MKREIRKVLHGAVGGIILAGEKALSSAEELARFVEEKAPDLEKKLEELSDRAIKRGALTESQGKKLIDEMAVSTAEMVKEIHAKIRQRANQLAKKFEKATRPPRKKSSKKK